MLLLGLGLSVKSQTEALNPRIGVEKMVLEKFSEMNRLYGTAFTIVKTAGATKANRTGSVEINTQQLLDLTKEMPRDQLVWMVTLTLAHEFFHLLQFQYYNRPFKNYEAKLMESQADILAGVYFYSRAMDTLEAGSRILLSSKGSMINGPVFQNAYALFFDIGTNTFAQADHPDHHQRMNSLVRGAMFGDGINRTNRIRHEHIKKNPAEPYIQKLEAILQTTTSRLGIFNSEDLVANNTCDCKDSLLHFSSLMDWSYDQARLITHGNAQELANIVIQTDKLVQIPGEHKWLYRTTLHNIGTDTLLFRFEIHMQKNTKDSANAFSESFVFMEARYHTVTIPPSKEARFTDTLSLSDSGHYLITIPPDDDALFYAVRKNKFDATPAVALSSMNQMTESSLAFGNYLLLLTDALRRQDYTFAIANMGHYSTDYEKKHEDITYNGYVPPGTSLSCKIKRDLKKPTSSDITIRIADFPDYPKADSVYNLYKNMLSSLYPENERYMRDRVYGDSINWKIRNKYFKDMAIPFEQRDKTTIFSFNGCCIDIHCQPTSEEDYDAYGNYQKGAWTKKNFYVSMWIYLNRDELKKKKE